MSVISAYFDANVNQCSPLTEDLQRVVKYDEDGNEYVTYEPIDYAALQKSLGLVTNWSLDSLLKAGIDPSFPIHTGYNTRLEGIGDIEAMATAADAILSENNEPKTDE